MRCIPKNGMRAKGSTAHSLNTTDWCLGKGKLNAHIYIYIHIFGTSGNRGLDAS